MTPIMPSAELINRLHTAIYATEVAMQSKQGKLMRLYLERIKSLLMDIEQAYLGVQQDEVTLEKNVLKAFGIKR